MTASPLVPVPNLPRTFRDDDGDMVTVEAQTDRAYVPESLIDARTAPHFAAAILAAAGCENHRVIDLGGPLPEVVRDADGSEVVWRVDGIEFLDDQFEWDGVIPSIRRRLAALEARAATPQHDPAEVEAINLVLARYGAQDVDAETILDALAAVRGEQR